MERIREFLDRDDQEDEAFVASTSARDPSDGTLSPELTRAPGNDK